MSSHHASRSAPASLSHYEILGISQTVVGEEKDPLPLLRRAYHRALLKHHPDKAVRPPSDEPSVASPSSQISVDRVSEAFAVLANPSEREEYDRSLRITQGMLETVQNSAAGCSAGVATSSDFRPGVETVDLDDLNYEEGRDSEDTWYRSCRCGNERGYGFTVDDLERDAEHGELLVGCKDCSLWLRVHFAVYESATGEERGQVSSISTEVNDDSTQDAK
jgi:curved DNA-binding protein CbpA